MNEVSRCPMSAMRDDRKSAGIAEANVAIDPRTTGVGSFGFVREILRSPEVKQDLYEFRNDALHDPEHLPVIFLDGELHKKRRGQLMRFFTPKAIKERHRLVMEQTTAELVAELRRTGRARLDLMSMQLACDVAAVIVGLTNSNRKAMARRIRLTFASIGMDRSRGLGRLVHRLLTIAKTMSFFWLDVMPAIRARKKQRDEDIISFLIDEGYTNRQILVECMTYATAGMLTTREFIVMVAWHLLEEPDVRQQFLDGGEETQFAILDEIIRLEPVAALLQRRAEVDMSGPNGEQVQAGEHLTLDLRAANVDEASVGECPLALDPDRAKRQRMTTSWLSFGDGPHRCPGAQVALHETRVFIDALLRVPGIRLANAPTLGWCAAINGYELHNAFVECENG